jgi:hypothetical protein
VRLIEPRDHVPRDAVRSRHPDQETSLHDDANGPEGRPQVGYSDASPDRTAASAQDGVISIEFMYAKGLAPLFDKVIPTMTHEFMMSSATPNAAP